MSVLRVDRLAAGGWLLTVHGRPVEILNDDQLDEAAQALAFRLRSRGIVSTGSGVEIQVGDDAFVHLCHSDEAEDAADVVRAAGRSRLPVTWGGL